MKRSPIRRDPAKALEWRQNSQKAARERKPKPRKPVKKVSAKRAVQNRSYTVIRRDYLERNPNCVPCFDGGMMRLATDIHHKAGRDGERLCDESRFLSVCRDCHCWIEGNFEEAEQLGYSLSKHRTA